MSFSVLPRANFGATCFSMSVANGKTDRLAAALRANLARRKAQSRARRTADAAEGAGAQEAARGENVSAEAPRTLVHDAVGAPDEKRRADES
ncbi:hypothetical protein ACT6QH_04685 [Xanthobacter sp. TB0139]|uniref:hypothetical protein n=1 Tax=Xanthobacter sp. TB0139 TaxID=3459178 RepID=UPI00403A635D